MHCRVEDRAGQGSARRDSTGHQASSRNFCVDDVAGGCRGELGWRESAATLMSLRASHVFQGSRSE